MTRWAEVSAIVNAERASPFSLNWMALLPLRAISERERMVWEPWVAAWIRVERRRSVDIMLFVSLSLSLLTAAAWSAILLDILCGGGRWKARAMGVE